MSFFGVELNSQINKLIFQIRLQLSRTKYVPNIRTIYKSFASYDVNLSGLIQSFNFQHALNANGLFFKKYEIQAFQKGYGENGNINWFTFLSHLREPMGPLRRDLVQHIFDSMDKQNKKKLSTTELMKHFNPEGIQSYKSGKKSFDQIQDQFLSLFAVVDDSVTREQFISFYDDMNINFAHNDVFFRHVSSQWHYTPEKLQAVQEEQIKIAIKNLRFKLIQKSQGTKDEFLIRKLFNQFDSNGNLNLGPYDLDNMMKKLGVVADAKVVQVVHQRLDKNNSGYIEFQEFKKFLYHDPYPY